MKVDGACTVMQLVAYHLYRFAQRAEANHRVVSPWVLVFK